MWRPARVIVSACPAGAEVLALATTLPSAARAQPRRLGEMNQRQQDSPARRGQRDLEMVHTIRALDLADDAQLHVRTTCARRVEGRQLRTVHAVDVRRLEPAQFDAM